ncbi:MAG: tRNA epoxyqueuosine(34) reductase QueG [Alphaproteobacteria bacterium]|nr:tRNA epoxyqueuosine(34) reductase QueG [Alphaproteobacteria bacterium]
MPGAGSATVPAAPEIKAKARAFGFDAVGITHPDAVATAGAGLHGFLAAGYQGDMDWLAATAARRQHPRALWPEVASIIVLGVNYTPPVAPGRNLARRERGTVSVYAHGADYHAVLKRRLKAFATWLHARHATAVKVFVDTAPVMEKPLAAAAGLGWQGKHTNLVSRQFGSWLFLGAVFTALALDADRPEADHCGSCDACQRACPTDAFPAPYQIDARRCISYLTIEHRGPIDRSLRAHMGNRIYGCDDCLDACPWNKFAPPTLDGAFQPRTELTLPRLADLATLDDAAFRQMFAGSAMKRSGRDRLLRNVLIAIGNSGDPAQTGAAEARLGDGAAIVRGAAVWALARLVPPARFADLRARHLAAEADAEVRAEWLAG